MTEAPYFVDLVNDTLLDKFPDYNFQSNSYRVYTTLDMNLQRDAAEAVRIGMEEADKRIQGRKKRDPNYPDPQVRADCVGSADRRGAGADRRAELRDQPAGPHSGEAATGIVVQAVCLCRGAEHGSYGYGSQVLTPATMIQDEPTTFWFDGKPYEPSNFEHKFYGAVSLRDALAHSLNVATVKVAEETGLRRGGGSGAAGGNEPGHPADSGGGAGGL